MPESWDTLGPLEGRELWYATLVNATWPLSLLDALPARFICCLVCRKEMIGGFDVPNFFRSLVAAGCRAISIFADGDRSLEDGYDRVVIDAGSNELGPAIWSSSHTSLDDLMAFLMFADRDNPYHRQAPIVIVGLFDHGIAAAIRKTVNDVIAGDSEETS